jgi:hypothetical protein
MASWLAEDPTDITDEQFSRADLLMLSKKQSHPFSILWHFQRRMEGVRNLDSP